MNITASQLQTQHSALIEALKRGEVVNLSYHGTLLGVITPVSAKSNKENELQAMNEFFGMHSDLSSENVEDELRTIREERRKDLDDI